MARFWFGLSPWRNLSQAIAQQVGRHCSSEMRSMKQHEQARLHVQPTSVWGCLTPPVPPRISNGITRRNRDDKPASIAIFHRIAGLRPARSVRSATHSFNSTQCATDFTGYRDAVSLGNNYRYGFGYSARRDEADLFRCWAISTVQYRLRTAVSARRDDEAGALRPTTPVR